MKDIFKLLPDIHFDWYARLIPGTVGICVFLLNNNSYVDKVLKNIPVVAALAYLIGHFGQSPASYVVKLFEEYFVEESENTKYKKLKGQTELTALQNKISKAHAEAVGMVSTALVLLAVLLCRFFSVEWKIKDLGVGGIVVALAVPALLGMMIERVFARKRKISDLNIFAEQTLAQDTSPAGSAAE
jgi:hypothetical protein